ncbi:CHAP domain-containing protein [Nocardioides sp. zg-ZUI104]|uniref:CHAP domain-containing protein n=1 Tax=Nocardioides faecalis TaxID=2803858 RepID=UPI001BCEDB3F|nr:CHAP domain-containing protein [Nocardioides faecalis]MBS4752662.1 CHAP domain-containing protein [Nocardioides faecalis]
MHSRGSTVRWATFVAVSVLMSTLLVLAPGPRALGPVVPAAGTTYLCSGYAACQKAGYSHAGYASVNDKMYWRMYAGHNCTNYVAYRMIKAGVSSTRPWTGGGNASEWGKHMSHITDNVPNVGAVAWWGRYSNGSGSAGHVAYVERVVSANEIVISEDSWGGTFHWRKITKSSGRWPTGFIHFVDKKIVGTARPVVTGAATVGATLRTTAGTWSNGPTAYAYQWYADGVAVPGATAATFTVAPAQLDKKLTVRVTAAKSGATSGVQDSLPTAAVAKGLQKMTVAPVVSGAALLEETITATGGTVVPVPGTTVWRWFADGVRISGNDTSRLPLTQQLVGKTITLQVVTKTEGYRHLAMPVITIGKVLAGVIEVPTPPEVVGEPRVGRVLIVKPAAVTPTDASVVYRWVRDGVPIAGATGTRYQLTPADAGAKVGVEVTATRPQYMPYTATVAARAKVLAPASIRLVTKDKGRKAALRVKVSAPGVSTVTGKVRFKVAGKQHTVRLVNGIGRVTVKLPRGTRKVRVDYLGSSNVATKVARGTVRVR